MGSMSLEDNPLNSIRIRRTAQARRLSLRVSKLDGRVTLTLPRGVSDRQARAFLVEKSKWIEEVRTQAHRPVRVDVGAVLPVEGRDLVIVPGDRKSPYVAGERVFAPEKGTGVAIRAWLIETARHRARHSSQHLAETIGRQTRRITVRDTRSRWGSCSQRGDIMLSWRLMLAPTSVFDYVVAHEVAHLKEMNHSSAFWQTVEVLMPDFEEPRRWLRENGTALHRYRFD